VKVAELYALEAVLGFLDQLSIESLRFQAILKAYTPGAIPSLFLGEKPAHWQAAGVVLRELNIILRLE
jgi:hypothetical protein